MRLISTLFAALLAIAMPALAQPADGLWQSLLEGNKVYVAGSVTFSHLRELRQESGAHQNPPVTVLSCSDSRVPPELIFNRSLDQLFVVRVAGNVASSFELGSIEFAIASGYTKMIVVMGHESCGAVTAALRPADPPTPSLVALVQRIRESFAGITLWNTEQETVRRAVEANARASAAWLVANSPVVREAVQSGKVQLVAAYYDLDKGTVERLR